MVRKLKYSEQKLLKKVDFINWEADNVAHENKIIRRYQIEKREHYTLYNQLSREIREISKRIRDLDDKNINKLVLARRLLNKLYDLGFIPTIDTLERCDITASSICRRRLPVQVYKNKMAPSIAKATAFVKEGHVRVGAELVTDPAFIVTRTQSDSITWTKTSKIRKHIQQYNNERDDFEDA